MQEVKTFIIDHLEEVKNKIGGVIGYRLQLSAEETEQLLRLVETAPHDPNPDGIKKPCNCGAVGNGKEVIDHAREALLEIRGRCEDHDRPTIVQMVDRIAAKALEEPSIVDQLKPYLEVAEKAQRWHRAQRELDRLSAASRQYFINTDEASKTVAHWHEELRAAVDKLPPK